MSYIFYNPNPTGKLVGDCVIRAISKVTNEGWDDTFLHIMIKAYQLKDMPSSNAVWGSYLQSINYLRFAIPNTCPDCYSIIDFCNDNPNGTFIVATGTHVVAVINGDYYDSWDSGHEIPTYFFKRGE